MFGVALRAFLSGLTLPLSFLARFPRLTWASKFILQWAYFFTLEPFVRLFLNILSMWGGGLLLLTASAHPKLTLSAVKAVSDEVTGLTPIFTDLAASTIEQITGITIDHAAIAASGKGADRQHYKMVLGGEFMSVVDQMLNVQAAEEDFKTRSGWVGSAGNLASYFGTNLDFQLRSLTIGTIASTLGYEPLRHLEGLHQSINWAFGFGWLSWSVLSNAMDVTVNAGIKRHYLALVKPHDISTTNANKLRIRNRIAPDVWGQIHDNAGNRNDARDWQLELEFNQPSMGVLQKAYEHGLATTAQVDEQMLMHELTPNGAEWQKQEILNDRKWKLQNNLLGDELRRYRNSWTDESAARTFMGQLHYNAEEVQLAFAANAPERIYQLREAVTKEHMKFLRHGWETPEDTRNWLHSQGWSEEEIQLALEANRLELKANKIPIPKHLTVGEVAAFVAAGSWDAIRGQQYLVNLGFSLDDTNNILAYSILQHAVSKTPKKVRDACETDNHIANFLTAALDAVAVLDPLQVAQHKDFVALIHCYIQGLIPAGSPGTTPPPQGPPAPQGLTAALLNSRVLLNWQPLSGPVDYIVYRREIGSNLFLGISPASRLTTYTDTGRSIGQSYVYAVRSRSNGVESVNSNEVIV